MTTIIYKSRTTGERCISDGPRTRWMTADELKDACLAALGYGDLDAMLDDVYTDEDITGSLAEVDPAAELTALLQRQADQGLAVAVPHRAHTKWIDPATGDTGDYHAVVDAVDVAGYIKDRRHNWVGVAGTIAQTRV